MLIISWNIKIPRQELDFSFARSSGPGGQNVNKVNSKAILSWNVFSSPSLPSEVRDRFIAAYKNKIREDGCLVLSSDQFRDQLKNVGDCIDKLEGMLKAVAVPPKERKATKPSYSSVQKRLQEKKSNSQKKMFRKRFED